LRSRFGANFKEALGAALRSLDAQERSFLRLHLVEGVTIDRLAGSSGVHRSTVVRRIAAARGNVLRRTRARLATTLRVEPSEVDSLIGLLQSRLDLSLGRLLQSAAPSHPSSEQAE
jgi:RNA polymerase sigma-70 factor (ECF subfamily)